MESPVRPQRPSNPNDESGVVKAAPELPGTRSAAVFATLTVGRSDDADLIIEHPTVSRVHAIIDCAEGVYFITDNNSKNGTRVNGRPVRERTMLEEGSRIRLGHVRGSFAIGEDGVARVSFEDPASAATARPGIVFACACGARLWAPLEAAGAKVSCRKCDTQVVVPGASEPDAMDSGATFAGVRFNPNEVEEPSPSPVAAEQEAPPEVESSAEPAAVESAEAPALPIDPADVAPPAETKLCSICQWTIQEGEEETSCPSCGLTFHASCWEENKGCSAYGCSQVNALATKAGERPQDPAADVVDGAANALANGPANGRRAGLSWETLLLGGGIFATVLGLLSFGAPPLLVAVTGSIMWARRGEPARRGTAMAGIAVALIGTAVGAAFSCYWWLDAGATLLRGR